MKAPRKKSSKSKETPVEIVELIFEEPFAPGTPSQILLNYAEGHYQKVYDDKGEMVFLDKHTQRILRIPDEAKHLMEVLHGYDILAG